MVERARDNSELQFVTELPEPAARGGRRGRASGIASELEAKPEMWARVGVKANANSAQGQATIIRTGKGPYGPAGCFEATVRPLDDGQFGVFARFVGEE